MADKGIIFSAAMVRALLDGRKTQTRRLCAWANNPNSPPLSRIVPLDHAPGWFGDEEGEVCFSAGYAPGQRLYVREAWTLRGQFTDVVEVGYRASENRGHTEYVEQWPVAVAVPGKAKPGRPAPKWPEWPKYGPSIHMPRWASRMWLAVTEVRVQRLQECSEADAIAEGIEGFACIGGQAWRDYGGGSGFNKTDPASPATRSYHTLWNSLHTAEDERWEDNPWVVAVTFKVHHGNLDAE
ncbi:hypothetical protein [Novosphingobium gossypii]|uniref:hypothetical protein n=1 Tax=Novosphingobium gossypii TaxID=1604774 RepID=UPI003D20474E